MEQHSITNATPDGEITQAAKARNAPILKNYNTRIIELEAKYYVQMAHLTCPATVWKYVVGAATKSQANLVMLDLEDSIPRDNQEQLEQGRANIIRAFRELDWGKRLRFFRPRGLELDPAHEDIAVIVEQAGAHLDGLIYPKIESAEEVRAIDATLAALEKKLGLKVGQIKIEVLIESAMAEANVFEIAQASTRLVGLILGTYDYWASLGLRAGTYRADHPLIAQLRGRIVKAAAAVGLPAIAEMTTNYPTKNKSEAERLAAIEEFRRDARLALDYGFVGKWTGIPEQTQLAVEMFHLPEAEIQQAIDEVRTFLQAEKAGVGATMIAGKMADRATDRIHRRTLKLAYAMGRIEEALAAELGVQEIANP
ncbi:MAG: HpcH/HpaI aldolase/citrate lyase family protein [Acidobacteria bacterium]|nr:HpcH/HpaI aldolase/citrate lyase family protein [Acidobacteriota bacterium]